MNEYEYNGVTYEQCRGKHSDGGECRRLAKKGTFKNGFCHQHQPAEQSVQRMGLWARLKKWFGAIAHR